MKYIALCSAVVSLIPASKAEQKAPSFPDLEPFQLFDEFTDDEWLDRRALFNTEDIMNIGAHHSNVCMEEREHEIEMCIAVPKGIKADDITITIDGNILTVRAQYKEQHETKQERSTIKKASISSFSIMRTLPVPVEEQGVSAIIENGILKITLPKKAAATKSIKVIQK